jgi:hypothetical protein
MIKRLCSLVAIAAVGGAFVAGCGGSSSSSSSSPSSSATPAAATSTSGGSTTVDLSKNPNVAAAVAQCKASIGASATLSADAKTKLQSLCDEAAKGDSASLKKATAQVCQQIVKDTVPAGAQAQALATCPKA